MGRRTKNDTQQRTIRQTWKLRCRGRTKTAVHPPLSLVMKHGEPPWRTQPRSVAGNTAAAASVAAAARRGEA